MPPDPAITLMSSGPPSTLQKPKSTDWKTELKPSSKVPNDPAFAVVEPKKDEKPEVELVQPKFEVKDTGKHVPQQPRK